MTNQPSNTSPENGGTTGDNGGAEEDIAIEMGGIDVQHADILIAGVDDRPIVDPENQL